MGGLRENSLECVSANDVVCEYNTLALIYRHVGCWWGNNKRGTCNTESLMERQQNESTKIARTCCDCCDAHRELVDLILSRHGQSELLLALRVEQVPAVGDEVDTAERDCGPGRHHRADAERARVARNGHLEVIQGVLHKRIFERWLGGEVHQCCVVGG